jgi:hypothetical protein
MAIPLAGVSPSRRKIPAPDSIASNPAGDKNYFGKLILTLALRTSQDSPARRAVLPVQDTSSVRRTGALIRV